MVLIVCLAYAIGLIGLPLGTLVALLLLALPRWYDLNRFQGVELWMKCCVACGFLTIVVLVVAELLW